MKRVLNFGSLNIDHVYSVDHFVRPGESLSCLEYRQFAGGKGANQSTALAHAGAEVFHAGKLGKDGQWLKDRLSRSGVDTSFLDVTDAPSGHAIIQVNREGENCIVLHGGANRRVTAADAEKVVPHFGAGDILLLQNEISAIPDIMKLAAGQGMTIVFNPAPMHPEVLGYPLDSVNMFILNETEAQTLTGETDSEAILAAMRRCWDEAAIVLTRGERGAVYADGQKRIAIPADRVDAVDTTAAGDTFIGYFIAGVAAGDNVAVSLKTACRAAAVCVTTPGAADSIPKRDQLMLP